MKYATSKVVRRISVMALAVAAGLCAIKSVGSSEQRKRTAVTISESDLLETKYKQDVAGMRDHAWHVFAGLIQPADPNEPDSPAIWDTWENKEEVFGQNAVARTVRNRKRTLDLPIEVLASIFSNNKDEKAAVKEAANYFRKRKEGQEVLFNPSAAVHVRQYTLYNPVSMKNRSETLKNLNSPISETSIVPFPSDSIVLKASWLKVGPTSPEVLSMWRPANQRIRGCEDGCMTDMLVKLAEPGEPCNLPLTDSSPILSSCFYSAPSETEGYRLILFGLHVATKEIQDWTWSTFWWQAEPDSGPHKEGRLDVQTIRGHWRNYVMDTTLSMVTPEGKSRHAMPHSIQRCESDNSMTAKICFNPYIELGMKNGELSNCANCHRQATFPTMDPDPRGVSQRGYLSSDDSCFGARTGGLEMQRNSVMKVDYMWSLSTIDPNKPLGRFIDAVKLQLVLDSK